MRNEHAPRAKLFAPFDSLKGLDAYLRAQEKVVVEKKNLVQDQYDLLNYTLSQIKVGMMVRAIYEAKDEYLEVVGLVAKLDLNSQKIIQIVEKKIALQKIVELEIISS